jgi:hypothetical protein
MFRRAVAADNDLTRQLASDPTWNLGLLLTHHDLSMTVRNDAAGLVDYLTVPEPSGPTRLAKLMTFALGIDLPAAQSAPTAVPTPSKDPPKAAKEAPKPPPQSAAKPTPQTGPKAGATPAGKGGAKAAAPSKPGTQAASKASLHTSQQPTAKAPPTISPSPSNPMTMSRASSSPVTPYAAAGPPVAPGDPFADDPHQVWPLRSNAATIFSQPTRRLWEAVCKDDSVFSALLDFPAGPRGLHPKFAGHFARIFEQFLRAGRAWMGPRQKALHAVIRFAIENVDVLAYQGLLCNLLKDFSAELDDGVGYKTAQLVTDVLKFAASRLMSPSLPKHDAAALDRDSLVPVRRAACRDYLAANPLVLAAIPGLPGVDKFLPRPGWTLTAPDTSVAIPLAGSNVPGRAARYEARKKMAAPARDGGSRGAEVKAFLCLSALRAGLLDNLALWAVIQSKDSEFLNVQLLLLCGVYGPPKSLATGIALRTLKLAIYGSPEEQWNISPLWDCARIRAILHDYAQDFEFRLWPTPQMRDALPLFWDFRYAHITPVDMAKLPELHVYDAHDTLQPVPLVFAGMTPLELYARYLLDDPALSDLLNVHFQDALLLYDRAAQAVRVAQPPDQRRVLEMDGHFLNLLRTPVRIGTHHRGVVKDAPHAIGKVLDSKEKVTDRVRPPVSEWAGWFAAFCGKSEFLSMDGPLGDVADQIDCSSNNADLEKILRERQVVSPSMNIRLDLTTTRNRGDVNIAKLVANDNPD